MKKTFLLLLVISSLLFAEKVSVALQPIGKIEKRVLDDITFFLDVFADRVILKNMIPSVKTRNTQQILEYLKRKVKTRRFIVGVINKTTRGEKGIKYCYSGKFGDVSPNGKIILISLGEINLNGAISRFQIQNIVYHMMAHSCGIEHCHKSYCVLSDKKGKYDLIEKPRVCKECWIKIRNCYEKRSNK